MAPVIPISARRGASMSCCSLRCRASRCMTWACCWWTRIPIPHGTLCGCARTGRIWPARKTRHIWRPWSRILQDKIAEMGSAATARIVGGFALARVARLGAEAVPVDSFSRVADRIFERHVEKHPGPAVSHAPAAVHACARRRASSGPMRWTRRKKTGCATPEGLRLTEGMFVAHVVGRSMEPRIPDGSLNIFRGAGGGFAPGQDRAGGTDRRARTVHREAIYQPKIAPPAKTNGATSASGWSRSTPSTKPST